MYPPALPGVRDDTDLSPVGLPFSPVGNPHTTESRAPPIDRMDFDEFTGEVQHRLELPGTGETVRVIRATLSSLGERIPAEAAEDFAASLPMEVDWYMTGAVHEHGQRFGWPEYLDRVTERSRADRPDAAYQAQVVVDLAASLVPESDLRQLRDQLPEAEDDENWRKLFEVVDAGGWRPHETRTGGGPDTGA
jgi:uncharacterized protein (DUF2267 family)